MTSRDKLIWQFLNRPSSLRLAQIEKVLAELGFVKIQARGSHLKYKHPLVRNDLIIPVHNNDCRDFYKKLAAKIVKENNLI